VDTIGHSAVFFFFLPVSVVLKVNTLTPHSQLWNLFFVCNPIIFLVPATL